MSAKMENDPKNIELFLTDLSAILEPIKDSVVEQWRLMKKKDLKSLGESDDGKFYIWDRPYYTKRMMEHKYAFDSDVIKEYFPLDHTISCMLGIFGHLFGLRFVNTEGHAHTQASTGATRHATIWHEDVLLFAFWDSTDSDQESAEFIGYLYMDLFCRPGKRPGFADLPIRPVRLTETCKLVNG